MHPARAWGITPAYAGKRPAAWAGAWRTGDHPRVCGEKVVLSIFLVPLMGSPPRVRGKVTSLIPALPLHGITPACAGKSFRSNAVGTLDRDHPRVCGEKGSFPKNVYSGEGSPPRVRGKVRCFCRSSSDSGITPACAGKRAMDALPSFPAGDHPRVCGEKAPRHLALCCILGSPPRVRGKARHLVRGAVKRGITPACAGKSLRTRCADLTAGDHPRVCGEKAGMGVQHHKRRGSPPRVRGKVFYYPRQSRKKRITPACAGKRQSDRVESKHPLDHPRVCGEKSRLRSRGSLQRGSPPRVRGKDYDYVTRNVMQRITPACAGKSDLHR